MLPDSEILKMRVIIVDTDGSPGPPFIRQGTPVNAVAASKLLTVADTPSEGDTVSVGGVTYIVTATVDAANKVLLGVSAEATIDNLVLAITAGEGEGVNYGTGTVANSLVTAVKASASTMTTTSLIKGVVGNSTAIAVNGADISWAGGAVALSGGINGTLGAAGQEMFDGNFKYLCIASNTIADANWMKYALTPA
jgi:hypothetical protein